MEKSNWHVTEYTRDGSFVGVCSGMGKNAGTWDSDHTKEEAERFTEEWNAKCPEGHVYRAEEWV